MGDGKGVTNETEIPTLHVTGEGVADTWYKTLQAVHNHGLKLRTQYDRKDPNDGTFIDPRSSDARVMVSVKNLFAEPRFPKVGYSELGKYIAEMLGAKDHLVVPREELLKRIAEDDEDFEATEWPYHYHQRLTAYPLADGKTINQLEMIAEKVAKDPITRRAVAITGVPEIDLFMKSDAPCLREFQARGILDEQGRIVLNLFTRWRSRDDYKAWADNVIGFRNLMQAEFVPMVEQKSGREVVLGPYSEENGSLHIYGQDYTEKGMDTFFEQNPTLEGFVADSTEKAEIFEAIIPEQLKQLKTEGTWKFPPKAIAIIDNLIGAYESGKLRP